MLSFSVLLAAGCREVIAEESGRRFLFFVLLPTLVLATPYLIYLLFKSPSVKIELKRGEIAPKMEVGANSGGNRIGDRVNNLFEIESHMVKAIFSALCCCFPLGIASIVFASKVKSQEAVGDIDGALKSSKTAGLLGNLSIGLAILFYLVVMLQFFCI
jgi:hypothetical protein